jgi:hypothetical protein
MAKPNTGEEEAMTAKIPEEWTDYVCACGHTRRGILPIRGPSREKSLRQAREKQLCKECFHEAYLAAEAAHNARMKEREA